jgi:hypothetical protein
MKVHVTKLMKRVLSNPKSCEELQQALVNPSKTVTIDGKIYSLEQVKGV